MKEPIALILATPNYGPLKDTKNIYHKFQKYSRFETNLAHRSPKTDDLTDEGGLPNSFPAGKLQNIV